jgi:SPP1 family predicted phage head-tail adaptor
MATLLAGNLRHRIAIQERLEEQDSDTGEITHVWATVSEMGNVPAEIVPLSAKEFIAAQATQSEIVARIVIRYREGIDATMRAVHNGAVYNIRGVLPDPRTGREWLTLPVSAGLTDGS